MSVFAGILYSNEILFQGFIDGLVFALIAMGLVLIYKATGVINFAQGAIGIENRIMPCATYIVCTEPLDSNLQKEILPNDYCVSDTNFDLNYYRLSKYK